MRHRTGRSDAETVSRPGDRTEAEIEALRELLVGNPAQQRRLQILQTAAEEKMGELRRNIELSQTGGDVGAMKIAIDIGRTAMFRVRAVVEEMKEDERARLVQDQLSSEKAARFASIVEWGSSALLLTLIGVAAWMYRALQQSAGSYRQTLDNMLEGCRIIDFDWRIRYVNDAATTQSWQRENLVGRKLTQAHPQIESTAVYALGQRCMESRSPQ